MVRFSNRARRSEVAVAALRAKSMGQEEIRKQWEGAASGWARWEAAIAAWMEPATEAMLTMAGVDAGARVLDLACGAGSQTLRAAQRVGPQGHVVASDIAEAMLESVRANARQAGLENVTTLAGAAEELELAPESFDAVVCRLGLMLFAAPAQAVTVVRRALRPRGKVAIVVFTQPAANPFMAEPMRILLRHAGKEPPVPGKPGVFALGAPGVLERLLLEGGFSDVEQRTLELPLRMPSAAQALSMMQEAFGAFRAVLSDSPESVRVAAWVEVEEKLTTFETSAGFVAPTEVLVVAGTKPA
jgi:ubiquinone/menaquinone biosynthesis C-methylase UbiE